LRERPPVQDAGHGFHFNVTFRSADFACMRSGLVCRSLLSLVFQSRSHQLLCLHILSSHEINETGSPVDWNR
jgi:hypothetical protein